MPAVLLTSDVTVDNVAYSARSIVELDRVTAADIVGSALGVWDLLSIGLAASAGAKRFDHSEMRARRTWSGRSGTTAYAPVAGSFAIRAAQVLITTGVTIDNIIYPAGSVVELDLPTVTDIVAAGLGATSHKSITLAVSAGAAQLRHGALIRARAVSGRQNTIPVNAITLSGEPLTLAGENLTIGAAA